MRELKFRAWDKKYKKMHHGDIRAALAYPDEDVIIEQFTGLKDKNGRDIYEGDILQNYAMRDVVVWENGCFVGAHSQRDHLGQRQPIAVHNALEVIGNAHENPEMLQ